MTIAIISHPDCLLHEMGKHHPEQPDRLRVIHNELTKIMALCHLKEYLAPLATFDQLSRAHKKEYIDLIFRSSPKIGLVSLDPDTYMNAYTVQAALRSAGAAILGTDLVMSGEVNSVFCNVRPPGHHAEKSKAMGFCFFNNVAIAALHALEHHKLKRVAIVDFDVHHGNGTEDIFQNDERVLYCSSFQSPFYPYVGEDTQNQHIINIPLLAGTTGKIFREKIKKCWIEEIKRFKPEMIFFSAGFDAYSQDNMSDLLLEEEDYSWVTHEVKKIADEICHGRIVSVLEGGYDLTGLGVCAAAHVRALL